MAPALAVILCLASGYLVVTLGWRRLHSLAELWMRISLSGGIGLGIFSASFLLARIMGARNYYGIDFIVLGILLSAFLLKSARAASVGGPVAPAKTGIDQAPWHRLLTAGFAIALCAALYSAILRCLAHPHGDGWDAFAIWNLHARFLFRGGAAWRDGFSNLIPWSHPDYPLLLPATIAHFWSYLGHENQAVPAVIGLVFTFSTVGLLFSSLAILRGRTAAMLGSLALLSTPFFFEQGTSQYADVPLSFFFLAAIALLCLYDRSDAPKANGLLLLSGLSAGFAAWTKNEGLLFLCALVAARMWVVMRAGVRGIDRIGNSPQDRTGRSQKVWMPLIVGALPALALILWFKHAVAPPGDLLTGTATLGKLLTPTRYAAVLKWYAKELLRFGHWFLVPGTVLLAVVYFLTVRERGSRDEPGARTAILTIILTLAGYFVIYLITPYDIYWHLRYSLNRLFLQHWPTAIFLFFLAAPLGLSENADAVSK